MPYYSNPYTNSSSTTSLNPFSSTVILSNQSSKPPMGTPEVERVLGGGTSVPKRKSKKIARSIASSVKTTQEPEVEPTTPRTKKETKGFFAKNKVVIIVSAVVLLGVTGYLIYKRRKK